MVPDKERKSVSFGGNSEEKKNGEGYGEREGKGGTFLTKSDRMKYRGVPQKAYGRTGTGPEVRR